MAQRYDFVALTATRTVEGFIRDAPVVGRTGILKYMNADGTVRFEYRPPEEAFEKESLDSLMGKPITVRHKGMVTAANVSKIGPIGSVLSPGRQDGDNIVADVIIYTLPTEDRELSCGYSVDLDETPGVAPDGQHYDAIQRNIRYNHVAVVASGRAGVARLNMDGNQEERNENMVKVQINGCEYEVAPEVKVFIDKMNSDAKTKEDEMSKLQAKYDTAIADLNKAKSDAAAAEKAHKDSIDAAVKGRLELLKYAEKHKVEKADEMADKDIKIAVIKAVHGDSLDLTGKSDTYIDVAFDLAKEKKADASDDTGSKQRQALNNKPKGENNDEDDSVEAAMAKLRKEEAEAWKKEVR